MTNLSHAEMPGNNLASVSKSSEIKKTLLSSGANQTSLWMVPIEQISIIEGFNVRVLNDSYREHIDSLAQSMVESGFLEDKPLLGFVSQDEGGIEKISLIDGHSRLAAVKIANSRGALISKVPIVIDSSSNIVDHNVRLINSNSGRELTSWEKALVIKRLHSYQLSKVEIARRTGVPENQVYDYINHLLPSPPILHQWIIDEKISVSFAVNELKKHGGNKAIERIKKAIENAEKSGSKKASKSHAPDAKFKVFLRKKSPDMAALLSKINLNKKIMEQISTIDPSVFELIQKLVSEGENALGEAIDAKSDDEKEK